jgi:thymidine kinase
MSLELIIGPMFAGKSSMILSRIRRYTVIGKKCLVLTHVIDTRYSESAEKASVKTHAKESYPAVGVEKLHSAVGTDAFNEADVVIVEEAQFYDDLRDFVLYCVELEKKDVLVVGLDGDSYRKPFGQVLDLIPYCDTITKLTALCKRCGDGTAALFSARVAAPTTAQVCVGAGDMYEAMCRRHFLENEGRENFSVSK